MERISLIKRLLYYGLLLLINFTMILLLGIEEEYGTFGCLFYNMNRYIGLAITFLIPHYIFGLIFLKTKWIFKLIVPFITAATAFGCIWLIGILGMRLCFPAIAAAFVLFIPAIFVWEIAYQILIKCLNKSASSQELL